MREAIAAEVRSQCARKRLTQTAIAKRLRLSQAAVSRRFTGDLPFDVEELISIAMLLDIPIADLLPESTKSACVPSRSRFTRRDLRLRPAFAA